MDKFLIAGAGALSGEISISGSKNAALPILAATLLATNPVQLTNVPRLNDIKTLIDLLRTLGATITAEGDQVVVNANTVTSVTAPYELVKTMRASILVLGPL